MLIYDSHVNTAVYYTHIRKCTRVITGGHDNLFQKYELLSPFITARFKQTNKLASKHATRTYSLIYYQNTVQERQEAAESRASRRGVREAGRTEPSGIRAPKMCWGGGGVLEAAHATVALKSLQCNCPVTSSPYCHVTVTSCRAVKSRGTRNDTPTTAP